MVESALWMLRVGLITYGLDRTLSGISRYTLELALAFEGLRDQVEIVLLTAGALGPLESSSFERVPLMGCARLPGLLTLGHVLIPAVARRLKLDIIHDPTAVTPLLFGGGGARIVTTVHDVFPLSYPGHNAALDNLLYRYWLPYELPRVDYIITDSQHSRSDILRFMKVKPERIQTVFLGVRALFEPIPQDEARAAVKAACGVETPYLLFVGNFTTRKNLALALRGFAAIQRDHPDLRLVLIGVRSFAQTPVEQLMAELKIADKVILAGTVEDRLLPAFYSAAEAFLFPSFYEGFGLPILEAMACGTPVITSNVSSMPEVAGDAALLIDPHSVESMVTAMQQILTDATLRQSLRARGLARAAEYTWERNARETLAIYQRVSH